MTTTSEFVHGLDDPDIIETLDVEALISAMRDDLVARFPAIVGVIDLESEPARKLIEVFAYRELLVRARVNDATRANLIAFANGLDLDHLSGFYDAVRLPGETDDALRARTILTIAGRSAGGPEERYQEIALAADVRVASALVYRDETSPIVRVAILSTDNGGAADQGLVTTVQLALDQPDARVISDTVIVEAAAQTSVNIAADIWLYPSSPISTFDGLETRLRNAWLADGGIGHDLTLSWLQKSLMAPGVQRVEVSAPAAHVIVPYNRAAIVGTVSLMFRGRDH